MKIYLDIDGTIIANDKQKANFAEEFIKWAVENHDVYWLTTHCRGDAAPAVEYLSHFFDSETMSHIKKIKATNWQTYKIEAIDFINEDFWWFDDFCVQKEWEDLLAHNKQDRLIVVNLKKSPNFLKDFLDLIKQNSIGDNSFLT